MIVFNDNIIENEISVQASSLYSKKWPFTFIKTRGSNLLFIDFLSDCSLITVCLFYIQYLINTTKASTAIDENYLINNKALWYNLLFVVRSCIFFQIIHPIAPSLLIQIFKKCYFVCLATSLAGLYWCTFAPSTLDSLRFLIWYIKC